MTAKSKPTFKIIEPAPVVLDYEAFREDFLDPYMSVPSIMDKYNITPSVWKEYRQKVLDETGLNRKPTSICVPSSNNIYEYIQKQRNTYIIVKTTKGVTTYYGRYKDYATAKIVRDKLVESGWDNTLKKVLINKYAMTRRRDSIITQAEEVYDKFKDYYLNSTLTIDEILSELGVSTRCYAYLLSMIRDEGIYKRRTPRNRWYKEEHQ